MARSSQDVIDNSRMGIWQLVAIVITVLLNALDGFDVISISFAAPGIASEWAVAKDVLGWVLSMELIGMAVGSIALGSIADLIGRKPIIMACLIVMTIGMFFATHSSDVGQLALWRFVTGLGIGGMLPTLNATVAEFSNAKYRNLTLPLMVIGYPLGAFFGGLVVKDLLVVGSWRDVFYLGAALTALAIPLALFLIPESPGWLAARRPSNALARINAVHRRFGLATLDALPELTANAPKVSLLRIFQPEFLRATILLTMAYLTHVTAYYYFVKWTPKLIVDMGHPASAGTAVLTQAMLGGAIGGAVIGAVAMRIGMRMATMLALVAAFILLNVFARATGDIVLLGWLATGTVFFSNAAAVGFYALLAQAYPPEIRATGTGFGLGFGRAGAAMGPALAGILLAGGMGLASVSLVISLGSLLALIAIFMVRMTPSGRAA